MRTHTTARRHHIGIAMHDIFCILSKTHLLNMIAIYPFPNNLAIPGHFNNRIVLKRFFTDIRLLQILVTQKRGIAP